MFHYVKIVMKYVLALCIIHFLFNIVDGLSPTEHLNSKDESPALKSNCYSQNCSAANDYHNDDISTNSKLILDGIQGSCASEVDTSYELLPAECITCDFNYTCVFGDTVNVTCTPNHPSKKGRIQFVRQMVCQYCYQSDERYHLCSGSARCRMNTAPQQYYLSNCTVKNNLLCLGKRIFPKNIKCNWTRGYSWSTALALSITLGGFGVDRFYLGMWQEGIGKLFSFGGLGIWTIIDVALIATGYLGPADGSVYID